MLSIIDSHVHVGRFMDNYFTPEEVGRFLLSRNVMGCVASATVAAVGRHDEAVRDLGRLMAVAGLIVWPLLWVTPGLLARHPDLKTPLGRLAYHGLKIHPRANEWSGTMLDRAFEVAEERRLGVLLHTDDDFPAGDYQGMLLRHPMVNVVLAHGRPIEQALDVLRDCPNTCVDTAFMPVSHVRRLVQAGFSGRILFGSDAPIVGCHYSGPAARRYGYRLNAILKCVGWDHAAGVMGASCARIFGNAGQGGISTVRHLPRRTVDA